MIALLLVVGAAATRIPYLPRPALCEHSLFDNCSTLQIIEEVASQYGLAALMQEKPFAVSHITLHRITSHDITIVAA